MQKFVLPAAFATQTLTTVRFIDNGAQDFQRIWVYGLTVGTGGVPPGAYNVAVRVEDGRGGFDKQSYVLNVTNQAPGEIHGRVFDVANVTGSADVPGASDPYLA